MEDGRRMRPALFALTAGALFAYWAFGLPTFEAAASRSQWPTVIWFSATLALLAVAVAVFGRMAGGRWEGRLAVVAGGALGVSSVANIIEDGLRADWFFAVFIVAELVALASLLALTIVVAATRRAADRLLAVVPAGTALGLLLFAFAGGILMLAAWLVSAAAATRLGTRAGTAVAAAAVGHASPDRRNAGRQRI